MRSDIQIQQDVMDQLKWEPDLNAAEIGVAVKKGVVTLSGIVDSYLKKIAAEDAAKKIAGVKAVAEDIQVGLSPAYRMTDAEIADAVVFALKWNASIPDNRLKVKVEDGIVSLEGELEWDYQRKEAVRVVQKLNGVRTINNYIRLRPFLKPENIKDKIAAAFMRIATIDSQKISVEVDGGKVILRGSVRSMAEHDDAENAAWAAPGVTSVENDLVLEEEEFAF
jgi:osmotically-inducible protein OsmY